MIQKPANKCSRGFLSNSTKKTYYKKVIVRIRMYVLLSVRHGEIDGLPRGTESFALELSLCNNRIGKQNFRDVLISYYGDV